MRPFLPLKGLALEDLRNSPPQKLDAALHIFLEAIGLPARQRQEAGAVRTLEIIYVAAVRVTLLPGDEFDRSNG